MKNNGVSLIQSDTIESNDKTNYGNSFVGNLVTLKDDKNGSTFITIDDDQHQLQTLQPVTFINQPSINRSTVSTSTNQYIEHNLTMSSQNSSTIYSPSSVKRNQSHQPPNKRRKI